MIQWNRWYSKCSLIPLRKEWSRMSTTADTHQEIPIACDLAAIPADERAAHSARAEQLLHTSAAEVQELPDGYAFRYTAAQYELVTQFIANERLCCPFFSFTLEV